MWEFSRNLNYLKIIPIQEWVEYQLRGNYISFNCRQLLWLYKRWNVRKGMAILTLLENNWIANFHMEIPKRYFHVRMWLTRNCFRLSKLLRYIQTNWDDMFSGTDSYIIWNDENIANIYIHPVTFGTGNRQINAFMVLAKRES